MSMFKVLKEKEQVDLGVLLRLRGLRCILFILNKKILPTNPPPPAIVVETTMKEVTPESRTDKRESFVVGVPQFEANS